MSLELVIASMSSLCANLSRWELHEVLDRLIGSPDIGNIDRSRKTSSVELLDISFFSGQFACRLQASIMFNDLLLEFWVSPEFDGR